MLKIITNPNPILRQKSIPVDLIDIGSDEMQKLLPEMVETMLEKDGVGLAAPQIGKNIRLIVLRHKDGVMAVFNPKITGKSILKEWDEEGCLSVPNKYGLVKRYKNVTVEFYDETGKKQKIRAKGLLARVFQHEIDHLDGILFIDKVKNLQDIK